MIDNINITSIKTDKPIIITGAAGFIGFHLSLALLEKGFYVVGIDNINDYYDIRLKHARLDILKAKKGFSFFKTDLVISSEIFEIFTKTSPDYVIHLAAQAGVRYCIDNPNAYTQSNLIGHMSILEAIREVKPAHTIYASSSSVYGNSLKTPFSTDDNTDCPVSLYAATKKSCEALSYSYADMYGLHLTGLRFFTVYGPYGRPDMAYFKFTDKILNETPIDVYNNGDMLRDFTYIDDIIAGIIGCINLEKPTKTQCPHRLLNIGHNHPEKLTDLIAYLEELLDRKAKKNFLPLQTGDVYATYANIDDLIQLTGIKPTTDLKTGLRKFIEWYKKYYNTLE